jgi:ectoine hydroxylase-related dioxygenase (phytanoyl-CoA dioxygenase family)
MVIKKNDFNQLNNNLYKKGFVVIKNFFSKKTADCYYKKIINKKITLNNPSKFHNNASLLYNLQNKDKIFLKLIFNKTINSICQNYFRLGAHLDDKNIYQFDALHSRILFGKNKPQNLHIDSRICGVHPPTHLHFFIYLKDVKIIDGPTQIVPYSHKICRYPRKSDQKKSIKITGDAGTLIIINSSLWHGSSEKISEGSRAILTLSFSRWHLRQTFAVPYGLPAKLKKHVNKKQKIILGYENYQPPNERGRLRMRGNLPNLIIK